MGSEDEDHSDQIETLIDTADRLERSLDHQIETIDGIDNKAEHVTRLLGILIGAILSIVAVAIRVNDGTIDPPALPLFLLFVVGLVLLLVSMLFSIVTYLSSRFKIGLNYSAGKLLSQSDYDLEIEKHYRRVIGTYAYNLEQNKTVIETNSERFRSSLLSLFLGVLFLSFAGMSFVISLNEGLMWLSFLLAIILSIVFSWYILTGEYLTLEDKP
jgi:hypothetical protein